MASKPGSPYNTSAYRRKRAAFIAAAPPVCCWSRCPIPGRHVDKRLPGTHPWGPTVDHRQATSRGGPMWVDWQLMHQDCNRRKGDRPDAPTTQAQPHWRT